MKTEYKTVGQRQQTPRLNHEQVFRPTWIGAAVALLIGISVPAWADKPHADGAESAEFQLHRKKHAGQSEQQERDAATVQDEKGHRRGAGLRPSPVDRSHMRGRKPAQLTLQPGTTASRVGAGATGTGSTPTSTPASVYQAAVPQGYTPPASFDLRTTGQAGPIRDQGACGDCWAFATMGSIESEQMKVDGGSQLLSANHLNVRHGYAWPACGGGNSDISMAYLTRWGDNANHAAGPVLEADDPYTSTAVTSIAGLLPRYHVQEVLQLPDRAGCYRTGSARFRARASRSPHRSQRAVHRVQH